MPTFEHLVICGGMSYTHLECAYDMKLQFYPFFALPRILGSYVDVKSVVEHTQYI
jgi:hypothetical protein